MKIAVTTAQMKKIRNGEGFNLTKKQLQGNDARAHNLVEFKEMNPRVRKKLEARKAGVRVGAQEYSGGSILGSLKSAGNSIKKTATSAGKSLNKAALKADLGGIVEAGQSVVPQSVTEEVVKAALMAGGADETSASIAAGAATQSFYDVNWGKSLKNQGGVAAKGAVTGGVKSAFKTAGETEGGALNNVQRRLVIGRHQEIEDRKARSKPSTKPNNGNTLRPETMVRQVAPAISGGSIRGGEFCPHCNAATGSGFLDSVLDKKAVKDKSVQKKAVKKLTGGSIKTYGMGRPAAGSQEMKDKMAKLRSMKKTGGSIKAY